MRNRKRKKLYITENEWTRTEIDHTSTPVLCSLFFFFLALVKKAEFLPQGRCRKIQLSEGDDWDFHEIVSSQGFIWLGAATDGLGCDCMR